MARSPFLYLFLPPLILAVIFIVPSLFCFLKPVKKKNNPENVLITIILSICLLATVGSVFVGFANASHLLLSFIFVSIFCVALLLMRNQIRISWSYLSLPFLLILAGSLYTNIFSYGVDYGGKTPTSKYEAKIDYSVDVSGDDVFPFYESDYLTPMNSANRYMSEDWDYFSGKFVSIYNVTDRTPLMYFAFIPILKIFGWNFFVYQMSISVLSSLYLVPLYFLALYILKDRKLAYFATSLGVFSHFFLFTSVFGPSKNFTLFFILSAFLFIFRFLDSKDNHDLALSGITFAMAYFSHQFSLIYVLAAAIFVFAKVCKDKKMKKRVLTLLAYLVVPVVLGILFWKLYVGSTGLKNTIYNNVMFRLRWGDAGDGMRDGEMVGIPGMISILTDYRFWLNKLFNFIGYFVFQLGPFKKHFDFTKVTLPGSLGVVVTLYVILFLTKKFVKENKDLYFLVVLFLMLPVLYNGFYIPMGLMWYALGVVPVFYIIFAKALDTTLGKKIQVKIMSLAILNSIIFTFWDSRTKVRYRIWNLFRNGKYPMFLVLVFVFAYIVLATFWLGTSKSKGRKKFTIRS